MNHARTVVLTRSWGSPHRERDFVMRAIAGAASRFSDVSVLTVAALDAPRPDGAFDVLGVGETGGLRWPPGVPADAPVIVDELTPELVSLLDAVGVHDVRYLGRTTTDHDASWRKLPLAADEGPDVVNVFVPVNELATRHRHHGFGFTGYVLVLAGPRHALDVPPPEAAWLTAGLPEEWVVVIEHATASAWKGRSLRGQVPIDTRTDLWRLFAHAHVCVDLAPGHDIARECIEALRLGTPVLAPAGSGPAAALSAKSGGTTFADAHELLEGATLLVDAPTRAAASWRGRQYADAAHGDPMRAVADLRSLLVGQSP